MSETAVTILVGAICLLIGVVGGFYLARRNFMNYMEKNPQINEDMVMSMMSQMGQKPSRKKINQVMSNMQKSAKTSSKTNEKIIIRNRCVKILHICFSYYYKKFII